MKIAIFGDSWASEFLDEPHKYLGWPEILANQPGYEVTNFAVPGSSVYYSYKEFLKNYKNYDVNIFLITSYGRMYVQSMPETNQRKRAKHISNLMHVEIRKKQLTKTMNQVMKVYEAMEKYYEYIQNDEYDELVDKALVHHARSMSTNTIFIPCFHGYDEFSLIDVFEMENYSIGAYEKYFSKNIHLNVEHDGKILTDARVCHMTKVNNELFAGKLIKAIEEKNYSFKFSMGDFVAPTDNVDEVLLWMDII
jgi:hypothetical protein